MNSKPSKSALKRQYHELQTLGETLIKLPEEQLRRIPLDDELFASIREAAGMKSHGALRRQRQLIGKLMRSVDAEPIRRALDAVTQSDRQATADFHRAEAWRDRLVADGRNALQTFPVHDPATLDALAGLIDDLHHCASDEQRRRLTRQVFRTVHTALRGEVHNPSS